MFPGHLGTAMVIGRAERRVNVGVVILAALLLAFLLWLFIVVRIESATIPANFTSTHQPEFIFPYSHGLIASLAWSALADAITYLWPPRLKDATPRMAILVATAVLSHWLLAALGHAPELPIAGTDSKKTRTRPVAHHAAWLARHQA